MVHKLLDKKSSVVLILFKPILKTWCNIKSTNGTIVLIYEDS